MAKDWTADTLAVLNRRRKAEAMAKWCLDNDYDPAVLTTRDTRRPVEQGAGLTRAASDKTWAQVTQVYDETRACELEGRTWVGLRSRSGS